MLAGVVPACLTLLSCAHAPELPAIGRLAWHEIADDEVRLRSCADESFSQALITDLAGVRTRLAALLPEVARGEGVPFDVHVFCRSADYTELSPHPAQGNHFVSSIRGRPRVDASYETKVVAIHPGMRGTQVAVRGAQPRVAADLVRHHYVHHLVRAHAEVPLWIEEGLAGFIGTQEQERDGVRRGRASTGMRDLDALDLQVPLGRVFRATDLRTWPRDEQVFFYRASWLLLHYLHFGKTADEAEVGARLLRYAERHAAGADEQEASEAAFGKSTIGLRSAIDRYLHVHPLLLRQGRVQERSHAGVTPAPRALPPQELFYGLGVMCLESGDAASAEHWFEAALRAEPESGRAWAGRARALAARGDFPAAADAIAHAESLAPGEPRVLLDAGWVFAQRDRTAAADVDDYERTRSRAAQVAAAHPHLAEAHYVESLSYWLRSERDERLAALARAHAASPGAIGIALRYAAALAEAGQIADARAVGTRVAGWVLGEARDREVYRFLDSLPSAAGQVARAQ